MSNSQDLDFQQLEPRQMLAQLLPDLFAWATDDYLGDYRIEGNLLRFSTALANDGAGPLEIRGGAVTSDTTQEVYQRIFNDDGTFTDRLAGEFTYHPGHGHIHFDGYAIYNLRDKLPDGTPGDIVATGGKVSFCLIDITKYNPEAGDSEYGSCGAVRQGISAGWSDVYGSGLSDQWIDITGIDDGEYFLEVVVDPFEQLDESDETNNTTIIPIDIEGGPGANGDRYEPNDSFTSASNWGAVSFRSEVGISIHVEDDVDYYQVQAAEDGTFDVNIDFSHSLGDLNLYAYDASQNLITSSTSTDDLEDISFPVLAGEVYYIKIDSAGTDSNVYEIEMFGPGDISTIQVNSEDGPLAIPDGTGSGQAGQTLTSTLEGPDYVLSDINLLLTNISHSWVSDLSFSLTSPAGTTVDVIRSQYEGNGISTSSGNNFTNTVIDDQAPTNFADGDAPYSGSFNVEHSSVITNPLAAFNGENALGTWTISITDWHDADTGTLNDWGILFTGVDQYQGDRFEANDAFPQAIDFSQAGYINEDDLSLHNISDVDFFRFNAITDTVADFDFQFLHDDGNIDVRVYDQSLTPIFTSDSINNNETFSLNLLEGELYYVEVYSDDNAVNDYTMTIDAPVQFGETGMVNNLTHVWQTISLDGDYDNPVIVTGPATRNGGDPVTVRVRNVTNNSFEVRISEWDYLNGVHNLAEDVPFMVMEAGTHTLADGTVIEAGTMTGDDNWGSVELTAGFGATPLILSQTMSENGASAVVTRVDGVSAKGFDLRLQEEEAANQIHADETIGWIAIQSGSGIANGVTYEAGVTGNIMSHANYALNYTQTFGASPMFFAGVQSFNGADPTWLRIRSSDSNGVTVYLEEERSADAEIRHNGLESMGYFFADSGLLWSRVDAGAVGGRDDGGDDHAHRGGIVDIDNSRSAFLGNYFAVCGEKVEAEPFIYDGRFAKQPATVDPTQTNNEKVVDRHADIAFEELFGNADDAKDEFSLDEIEFSTTRVNAFG